jgi:hypothetical protein
MMPKPEPNFIRLDPGLPEVVVLVTALLQAREAASSDRGLSRKNPPPNIGGPMCWRTRGHGALGRHAASMVEATSRKLSERTTRLQTSTTQRSRWHAENARGAQHSPAQTWLRVIGPITPCRPCSITLRRPAVNGSATSGIAAVSTTSIRSIEPPARLQGHEPLGAKP